MITNSQEYQLMVQARNKLNRLIAIQHEKQSGKLGAYSSAFKLTETQIAEYLAARQAEKQQLVIELVAMMQAYLETLPE